MYNLTVTVREGQSCCYKSSACMQVVDPTELYSLQSVACYLGVSLARTGLHSSYFYTQRHNDNSSLLSLYGSVLTFIY